ncbi:MULTISPECIES: hypothetical protein [Vibrio]|uniref:Uncharacterized protein n=1 Tax=Vibrio owensii CAIM 1854 = LMG 25443 TaxID=1229493 RepID=A0A0C1Z6E2_9VIBR|nr:MULTISPECIES: hypothetical protein [Vibrio]MCU8327940.1 hypothetical protein [Vibrio vulnificus]MDW1578335.1 hypothetical protein [Vibrio sp. Vb2880]HDI3182305.1 hypothetical protein [Vibrio cholerae]EGQ8496931.1 hypothetical protein [Vibrio alginolyticus]EGR1574524.1 hypothetical protein [Vibrio alginolyticus]
MLAAAKLAFVQRLADGVDHRNAKLHGHDMAEEVAGAFPDIDELEKDVADLDEYFTNLKKRRK